MLPTGLRGSAHLSKPGDFLDGFVLRANGEMMPRWLLILAAVAVIATIAGFVTFGGGNMGH
jgi:hypothetical protein